MIKVDANLFRLVYTTASTEETRYYLNGVNIEPHPVVGAILIATDGHRMMVAHDHDGSCSASMIVRLTRETLAACKPLKGVKRRLIVDPDAKSATVEEDTKPVAVSHDAVVDGVFPNWRKVVPVNPCKPSAAAPTSFNPFYLREFGRIGQEIAKTIGGDGSMRIGVSDAASPVIIRWADVSMFGVLMPMRTNITGLLPAFMDQPAQLQAAE